MKAEVCHDPNMAIAVQSFNDPGRSTAISARNRPFSGLSGHKVATLAPPEVAAIDATPVNA